MHSSGAVSCFLVDPYGDDVLQGIVWIKERESKHNLHVVRMGAPSTVTAMERAMEAGHSVLIENMGENIDAVLNPVITRSTFKKVCL